MCYNFCEKDYSKTLRKSINKSLLSMVLLEAITSDTLWSASCRTRKYEYCAPILGSALAASVCRTPREALLVHIGLNSALKKQNSMIKI